eukprot:1159888-Pelagomonas_calceolata.AAC.8
MEVWFSLGGWKAPGQSWWCTSGQLVAACARATDTYVHEGDGGQLVAACARATDTYMREMELVAACTRATDTYMREMEVWFSLGGWKVPGQSWWCGSGQLVAACARAACDRADGGCVCASGQLRTACAGAACDVLLCRSKAPCGQLLAAYVRAVCDVLVVWFSFVDQKPLVVSCWLPMSELRVTKCGVLLAACFKAGGALKSIYDDCLLPFIKKKWLPVSELWCEEGQLMPALPCANDNAIQISRMTACVRAGGALKA